MTVIRVPPAGLSVMVRSPPWICAKVLTSDRPTPVPGWAEDAVSVPCSKGLMTRCRSVSGMPGPSSSTVSSTPSGVARVRIQVRVSGGVCRQGLRKVVMNWS